MCHVGSKRDAGANTNGENEKLRAKMWCEHAAAGQCGSGGAQRINGRHSVNARSDDMDCCSECEYHSTSAVLSAQQPSPK